MTTPQFTRQRMSYALEDGDGQLVEASVLVDHRELRAMQAEDDIRNYEPAINAWSCWHALKRRGEYDGDWASFDARCAWAVVAADEETVGPTSSASPASSRRSNGSSTSSPSRRASPRTSSGRKTPKT